MKKSIAIALSVLMLSGAAPQMVQACAFDTEVYFSYTSHPDLPLNKFAAGQLGILDGGFARSYLLTAYRYLSDKPLTAAEQKGAVDLWNARLLTNDWNCTADTSGWTKAREGVGAPKLKMDINPSREVSNDEAWQSFCNCQTSAFQTAADTLKGLVTKFGAKSSAVKDWVAAQDDVFSNCGWSYPQDKAIDKIPAPLPATADVALQQDRAYQIAAANFYAMKYDVARQEFEKIAADKASPWSKISGYLAVRAMLREASLPKTINTNLLAQAKEKLEKLIADPSYGNMKSDLADLSSFVQARVAPDKHLHELATQEFTTSTLGEITKTIDSFVETSDDGTTATEFAKLPAVVRQPEIIDWVMTYQSDDKAATQHSVNMWKKTHSLPWLVAAISKIDANDPNSGAIMTAAAADKSPAAKWTLFYNINRLNLDNGKDDLVRTELDKVFAKPPADLPLGALNSLKTQRLALSNNLVEFVRFGVQQPLAVCSNGGTEQVPDDIETIVASGKTTPTTSMVTPDAGEVIDNRLPLAVLKQLARQPGLPADVRNNVAWSSWVRAILIGDDTMARELAQVAKPLNKARTKLFDSYLAAATPEEKKFAASMVMMRFSSATPNPAWGSMMEDSYGDASGWWWSAKPVIGAISRGWEGDEKIEGFDPIFVTAAQKAQAKKEITKLGTVEAAPNYFAKVVLPYAKAHPADPRVPEALHLLVKATRYGTTDDASKVFSKQAFTMLHTKYKANTWTKQTPYYY